MTTSWLVLCAAGGHEREAARLVNQNHGASYLPYHDEGGKWTLLLPGYVLARWIDDTPPFAKLYGYETRQGMRLIWGLKIAPDGNTGVISQRDVDIMEAHANDSAKRSGIVRHKTGDLIPQKLGLTGAEVLWRVTEIANGIATMQTVLLGKIIERKVREAA